MTVEIRGGSVVWIEKGDGFIVIEPLRSPFELASASGFDSDKISHLWSIVRLKPWHKWEKNIRKAFPMAEVTHV